MFLAGIGGGIVFPILPLIGERVGLSLAFIGLILAANRIGRVVSNPLVGIAVDRFGGKPAMVVGLIVEVGVMGLYLEGVLGHATGLFFLLGRLVWGPGSALVFIGGQTLALHASGPEHRGLVTGIVRSAMGSGTPAGLVVGGVVAGVWGDPTAFVVAMFAALAAALFAWRMVPNLRGGSSDAARDLRATLRTLADRRITAIASLSMLSSFAVQGLLLTTLVLLVTDRGLSLGNIGPQAASGLFLALLLVASAVVTPFAGRLADRPGLRARTATAGIALMVPGFVLVALAHHALALLAGLGLVGVGLGGLNTPLLALLGDLVPSGMRGSAVGGLQLFSDTGGTLGPIVGTAALGAVGFTVPYAATAGLLVLVVPLGLWLSAVERRTPPARASTASAAASGR